MVRNHPKGLMVKLTNSVLLTCEKYLRTGKCISEARYFEMILLKMNTKNMANEVMRILRTVLSKTI